jgi:23S rRNA (uridine2552-2'-O)-methyltransferase
MPKPYIPNDKWAQRAAAEGYRARSVYKLQELDERFGLFAAGMKVLDIGAAPGSWLQYASKKVGEKGVIVGIDLQPIEKVAANVRTFVCDITDHDAVTQALASASLSQVDLVLSDIAPNTSGIHDRDQWLSVEFSRKAALLAEKLLVKRGTLVMKVFQGRDFDTFLAEMKKRFKHVKVQTVAATRDRSREVYVVCKDTLHK